MVRLQDNRREWLENLSELRKKKEKELNELEDKKKKELEEAEEMLKAGSEELTAEEEEILDNLRKEIPELQAIQDESLEEVIKSEEITEEAKAQAGQQYQVPIEETVQAVYENSEYSVYNDLKDTLGKIQSGEYLSQAERSNFYERQQAFEKIVKEREIIEEKDSFGYIERSKQIMSSIADALHNTAEYKR